ncbi:hypothetical protein OROHE_000201 [Orobanche hederae]
MMFIGYMGAGTRDRFPGPCQGLSPWITKRDIERHFSTEGKVEDVHLVVDPRSTDPEDLAL